MLIRSVTTIVAVHRATTTSSHRIDAVAFVSPISRYDYVHAEATMEYMNKTSFAFIQQSVEKCAEMVARATLHTLAHARED